VRDMLFRLKESVVDPRRIEAFNEFFGTYLLPIQRRHGARLVGRWQDEAGTRIVALWAYESRESSETIRDRERSDPASIEAQTVRRERYDPLFISSEEHLMESTVPLERTELRHLGE
jgi:8-oxo-dGTP diphosphatase